MTKKDNDLRLGRRPGRPKGRMLEPEHAEAIRNAVKAACRYYGIRLQDLGLPSGGWVADAMRTSGPMSVLTAEKLYRQIQQPRAELVGRKHPQGPPLKVVWEKMLRRYHEGPNVKTESFDPATEYVIRMFYAGIALSRYLNAWPGVTLFVLPGSARSLAEILADTLPLGKISARRRLAIIDVLSEYFRLGEKPLRTELGKKVVPRLWVLGHANLLETAAEMQDAAPDGDPLGIFEIMERVGQAVSAAEERRNKESHKPKSRPGKRRSVLRRIRDLGQ